MATVELRLAFSIDCREVRLYRVASLRYGQPLRTHSGEHAITSLHTLPTPMKHLWAVRSEIGCAA